MCVSMKIGWASKQAKQMMYGEVAPLRDDVPASPRGRRQRLFGSYRMWISQSPNPIHPSIPAHPIPVHPPVQINQSIYLSIKESIHQPIHSIRTWSTRYSRRPRRLVTPRLRLATSFRPWFPSSRPSRCSAVVVVVVVVVDVDVDM